MALSKDVLGEDLYNRSKSFNDVSIAPEDLEAQRLAWWQSIAEGIIAHFKDNGVLTIPGTGLTAGAVAVTGVSITGNIS